jgi:hypothetical protein
MIVSVYGAATPAVPAFFRVPVYSAAARLEVSVRRGR